MLATIPANRAGHYAGWEDALQIRPLPQTEHPATTERLFAEPPCDRAPRGARSWIHWKTDRRSGLLLRRDHHHHLPPFQARSRFDHDVLAEVGLDPRGHLAAELLVAHLATTEADVDLELVALFQELAPLARLDLLVSLAVDGPERDFFVLDVLILLFGGFCLLLSGELD